MSHRRSCLTSCLQDQALDLLNLEFGFAYELETPWHAVFAEAAAPEGDAAAAHPAAGVAPGAYTWCPIACMCKKQCAGAAACILYGGKPAAGQYQQPQMFEWPCFIPL